MTAFPKGTKYESDDGDIHPIRISAKVLAAAGTAVTGAINNNIPAKVSKGNREFGLRPRGVRIGKLVGTDPDQFTKYAFIPVLQKVNYGTTPFVLGGSITYDGSTWTVVGLVQEDYS